MIYIFFSYLFSPLLYMLLVFKKKEPVKRILIIQTAKIGDLICSTPVFREVRKKYPLAHITAMINPVTKDLLENSPHVNDIISLTTSDTSGFSGKIRLTTLLRKGNYDVAVSLNPSVPYAVSLFWALVPVRLSVMPDFAGVTFKLASVFFTYLEKHLRGSMVIETYLRLLRSVGIKSDNISKEIYKSEGSDRKVQGLLGPVEKPLLGIAVSSGNKMKELGAVKIIEIADTLLSNRDCMVLLIGSSEDRAVSEKILAGSAHKDRIINMAGNLGLAELPALLEQLSLFIGVDSGITYMADALAIPLINIAGPADMEDQRPTGEQAMIIQEGLSCVPCSHAFKSPYHCSLSTRQCIQDVSVDQICSLALNLLSGDNS